MSGAAPSSTRRRLEEKASERKRLREERRWRGLLDAVELAEAERWVNGPDAAELGVSDELKRLVADSRGAIDAAALEKERDAERLRRRNQGLAVALAAAVLLLMAAIVLFFNARNAEATAQANADEAAAQAAIAKANADEAATQEAIAQTNAVEANNRATQWRSGRCAERRGRRKRGASKRKQRREAAEACRPGWRVGCACAERGGGLP